MAVSNEPLTVDPAFYHAASSIMGQEVATQLQQALNGLTSGLSRSGAMAGSDEGGQAWAGAYDEAASTMVGVLGDLVNACHQLAAMLEQTGFNHSTADDASNPAHPMSSNTSDTTNYAAMPDVRGATPPSANGGSGDPPFGWGLIEHAVGYLWPNGDPGRLRDAGRAWSTAANGLNGASSLVPQAVSQIQSQQAPEVQDAVTVCQGMRQHIDDAAASCRDLANACSQYADHIDQAHHDIEDEITSFLEWSAVIEGVGILATEIGGELWAQGPEAGRVAVTAGRVANIIRRLIEAAKTVAQAVRNVVSKIGEIAQRLKSILGARLSSVTTKLVEKLPGQAKTAEETAEKNLAQDGSRQVSTPRGNPGNVEDLNPQQLANYQRYIKKLPAKNEGVEVELLDNGGVRLSSKVPANNVPGSYAEYIKILDKEGNTVQYVKDTYAPDGTIVHSKIK